jgi:ribosomal RNA-processing protein 12
MASTAFENTLAKIRPHTTSKQAHQRKPAQLLVALESTLQESTKASANTERNPTSYFAALLTTLGGCLSSNNLELEDGSNLTAILYLFALVLPFVPPAVVRAHLPKIFQLLPPLLPLATTSHAPSLRSLITIFGIALTTMDQSLVLSTISLIGGTVGVGTGTSASIRQTFSTLLELVLDARPKVRKRAGEVVKTVLESPPSPLAIHPWSALVAEWSCGVVAQRAAEAGEGVESLIHLMTFLRTIPFIFVTNSLTGKSGSTDELRNVETITRYLLAMPKLSNPYLTQASYQLLTALLATDEQDEDEDDVYTQRKREQIATIQRTLLSNAPIKADTQLAPYWLAALSQAIIASRPASNLQAKVPVDVWSAWREIWQYLDASCSSPTRESAADALCSIIEGGCIRPESLGGVSARDEDPDTRSIVELIGKSLTQLVYANSIEEILQVSTTLAKYSSPLNPSYQDLLNDPATNHQHTKVSHLLIPLLEVVVKLRGKKGFEYKEHVDKFLAAMMGAVGVDTVVEHIPLGLLPKERCVTICTSCFNREASCSLTTPHSINQETQPNAYLLPLIPSHHPTPLSHFVAYFIPLSESLWELAEKSEKDAEKKVYRVLMEQIWNAFPSYCRGGWDIRQVSDTPSPVCQLLP